MPSDDGEDFGAGANGADRAGLPDFAYGLEVAGLPDLLVLLSFWTAPDPAVLVIFKVFLGGCSICAFV